jgi:cytoskeletal protein RodZ
MFTFIVVLIFVFVAVDLLVRFVIEPMLTSSKKKKKAVKSFSPRFDPTVTLATETMYDGGEPHNDEKSKSSISDDGTSADTRTETK